MQSVWIPDAEQVFVQAEFVGEKTVRNKQNKDEKWAVVRRDGREQEIPAGQVFAVNPGTFDRIDDMSELTHLNEPSVLHNLENRYADDNIYTYSGLFLVAINPYSNIRIYTQDYISLYHGSPKEDNKPHIFAVAEEAYQNLLSQRRDQSILVTGESGAGKTENTKKILQYLASITSEDKLSPDTSHESFERKILQSNPILESFGNAQTVRNNNSSRFGKFIKIEFDELGKINGAHVDWYLLEKSRIIQQSPRERNYHIFYQMLSGMSAQDLRKYGLESNSIKDYGFLRNSNSSIPGVDDTQDFHTLLTSFNVVGFTGIEVQAVMTCIAIILHIGNIEFVSERAEQASISGSVEVLCKLLGVTEVDFKVAVLRPKAKAGKDWVSQSKNALQARFILNSLSRSLYENLFAHIVQKINSNLDHGSMTENYIGLLDIAGFEIFKHNSFEQLCINYTNEKLQQFFNHHMFVLEQNEYLKENVQWNFVDYGKDLQSTIDLIEKKDQNPGVLPLLDEESILPKSTDESFYSKLDTFCNDKSSKFKRSKKDKCFILKHYAGDVEYNVEGWLSKNKDPLHENLLQVLSSSENDLIKQFYHDKDSRGGSFKTTSIRHRSQLNSLLDRLSSTEPHFVRCIIPNDKKKAHDFNRSLILDQLRCNGVLEGIRIAREGYPNRIFFKEFFQRYKVLTDEYRFSNNSKKNCEIVLSSLHLDPSVFKVGNSKLFFKAGVLASLEAKKESRISDMMSRLNAMINGSNVRRSTSHKLKKLQAAQVLSSAFKTYDNLMGDHWFNLYVKIKPLLESTQEISKTRKIAEQVKSLESKLKIVESKNEKLQQEKENISAELKAVREKLAAETENLEKRQNDLRLVASKEAELNLKLEESQKIRDQFAAEKEALEKAHASLQGELTRSNEEASKSHSSFQSLQNEKVQLEQKISELRKQVDKSERSQKNMDSDKNGLLDQIKLLKSSISEKDRITGELKEKLSASDKELERSLQGLEKKFTSTSKRLTSLVEENKSLRETVDRAKKEQNELHNGLQAKEKELRRLNERSDQNQTLIASLNKERADLAAEHEKILNEAKELRKEASGYKKRYQELEETCSSLKDDLKRSLQEPKSNSGEDGDSSVDLKKFQSLEEQLVREKSLTKFLNERLVDSSSSRPQSRSLLELQTAHSVSGEDIYKACDELKQELRETSYRLEKEINNKKDLISKLRFTETRLASASFEIQTMSSQLKKLKSIINDANLNVNLEEVLGQIEPVEINHEKLILEVEYLKGQLEAQKIARLDAENAASALHTKFRQIQRSDSSSDIFRLKYEASEQRVKSLESKMTAYPLRDRTNTASREIFTHRESISKYEEDLRFYRLENYKLQDLLVESEKQINALNKCVKKNQADRVVLGEQLTRAMKDLEVTERQNALLATSSKNHKVQYESCIDDLHATEEQLKDVIHALRQSEDDIKTMTAIIERLKSQNRQKDKQLWELETRNNTLESETEEKAIDNDKLCSRIQVLTDDLSHFKDRLRLAEDKTQFLEEIEKLKADLDLSLRGETELKKEVSSLNYSLESLKIDSDAKINDLLSQTNHYEQVVGSLIEERDAASAIQKELEENLKHLQGKVEVLNDSIKSLLDEKRQLEHQNDDLKTRLEQSKATFGATEKERENAFGKVSALEKSMELQRKQNDRNEALVEQLQASVSEAKSQLAIEKDKNIVLHEENQSFGKSNNQLRERLTALEAKLEDTSEKEAWLSKVQELEVLVAKESDSKFEEMKRAKSLERTVAELKAVNEKQAETINMANDDRLEFSNELSEKIERLAALEKHIAKQEIDMKRIERDKTYQDERILHLQSEVELWKEKYSDLSTRREKISVHASEEVFI
ncbi:myosin 1 [Lachancea thermotolerans CBS 6340]|uniref:KLTH0G07128p n=1 Tax=Lachancea thermotolerans (strain ATCC 56472 / CBS 6340 / NRRL Y-8284) TaxID=559295 RepID=C5DMA0_LACTC|nr:KLTH0G07128p [Lachancea thermotolerans CBS 6340]CAR24911.1 KLTH0G07128p [Lachancea thermotolerans CBS 6340]